MRCELQGYENPQQEWKQCTRRERGVTNSQCRREHQNQHVTLMNDMPNMPMQPLICRADTEQQNPMDRVTVECCNKVEGRVVSMHGSKMNGPGCEIFNPITITKYAQCVDRAGPSKDNRQPEIVCTLANRF